MGRRIKLSTFALLAAVSLGGCVASDIERAGAGAVLGGLTAAAVHGNIATGVAVGAAGGALCDDVSLC